MQKKASLALKVLVICCEFLFMAWKNASMLYIVLEKHDLDYGVLIWGAKLSKLSIEPEIEKVKVMVNNQ